VQDIRRSATKDDPIDGHAMEGGELAPERCRRGVRVACRLRCRVSHRRERMARWSVRTLVAMKTDEILRRQSTWCARVGSNGPARGCGQRSGPETFEKRSA